MYDNCKVINTTTSVSRSQNKTMFESIKLQPEITQSVEFIVKDMLPLKTQTMIKTL